VNEEEVITTVRLLFVDAEQDGQGINQSFELKYSDPDGDGGQDPVITADPIPSGRYYNVAVTLLDESRNPAVNVTPHIQAEGDEHQFFYEVNGLNMVISNLNTDADGMPLGLTFNAHTLSPGTGTLKVTLRHGLDKDADGVADGDITNAGGDTDIEVVFPVEIY
jgi:hypothetical protein